MAVKAAYELPYTGEEVQEMLEQAVTNKGQIENLGAILDDKVDKVEGKDLSTNDYTDEEKEKLSSLENGAQKNVQSDWNAISGDAYIKNKPTIPTKVSELENDRGYTSNVGTITGIMMNGASKGTNGVVNLGTVLTQHQDISGKADRADAIGSLTLSMNDTNYQITLSGTKVDGTPFTVSNVIDLPLESVVVSGSYNKSTKEVVLTLKDGSTIDFSVADLVSGLQSEITTTNKLSADLVQNGTTNKVLTAAEKTKLANIEEGAQQNVQADWNAASGDAFIKNKPTIPQGVTVDDALSSTSKNPVQNKVVNTALNSKQNTIQDLSTIRSGANAGATAYQKPANGIPKSDLASGVQTSLNKADSAVQTESDPVFSASPAAHITNEDITSWNDKSDFSGSYNDLTDKPTIPAAQVQSDWNQTNTSAKDYIKNKPTIPQSVVIDNALSSTSENPVQNKVINNALNGKQSTINDLASIRSGASAGATAYQKPSSGIPKSDLSTGVQSSLNKADTALQSYKETDPVFSASPAAGITSNDITEWDGKADPTPVVNHGTSDTTFSLTPNVLHIWGTVSALTLTLATPTNSIVNEYMFQFTSGSTATTLSLPSTVVWDKDKGSLTVESGYIYQVSILNNVALWARVAV